MLLSIRDKVELSKWAKLNYASGDFIESLETAKEDWQVIKLMLNHEIWWGPLGLEIKELNGLTPANIRKWIVRLLKDYCDPVQVNAIVNLHQLVLDGNTPTHLEWATARQDAQKTWNLSAYAAARSASFMNVDTIRDVADTVRIITQDPKSVYNSLLQSWNSQP